MSNKTINQLPYHDNVNNLDNILISPFTSPGVALRIMLGDIYNKLTSSLNYWTKPQILTPIELTTTSLTTNLDLSLGNEFVITCNQNSLITITNPTNYQQISIFLDVPEGKLMSLSDSFKIDYATILENAKFLISGKIINNTLYSTIIKWV